jgi:excisionase family DNA binding protein
MKTYSIAEAARILEVDRKTLRRWIGKKVIPAPAPGIVQGRLAKVWTDRELMEVRNYMSQSYWGKGIDRRTGKKALNRQTTK